jgi:hypothetical protein
VIDTDKKIDNVNSDLVSKRRRLILDNHATGARIEERADEYLLILPSNTEITLQDAKSLVEQWLKVGIELINPGDIKARKTEAERIAEVNRCVKDQGRNPSHISPISEERSLSKWLWTYQKRNPVGWYKIFPEEDHLLLQTLGIIGYKHKSRIKELDGLVKEAEDFPVLAPKHLPQTEFQKWALIFIPYYGKDTLLKLLSPESQEILKSATKRKITAQRISEINTFVKKKSRNPSQYSQDALEKNLAIWFQNYSKMHPDDWYKIFPEEDHLLLQSLGIIGFGHKANIKKLDTLIRKTGKYRPLTSAGGKPRTEFQNWTRFFIEFYGKETLIKLLSPESQKILLELNQGKRS